MHSCIIGVITVDTGGHTLVTNAHNVTRSAQKPILFE